MDHKELLRVYENAHMDGSVDVIEALAKVIKEDGRQLFATSVLLELFSKLQTHIEADRGASKTEARASNGEKLN